MNVKTKFKKQPLVKARIFKSRFQATKWLYQFRNANPVWICPIHNREKCECKDCLAEIELYLRTV